VRYIAKKYRKTLYFCFFLVYNGGPLIEEKLMKTYFLVTVPENYTRLLRLVITTDRNLGEIKNSVTAKNFFDAKLKFGFELTDLQTELFNS
jgi:hypothetical protein